MPAKTRLYGKREPRLPIPKGTGGKSFALRTLENADHRYAVVKSLRSRLERLKEEAGVETFARECLAARAVFLVARIESLEYDAVTGKSIAWREYISATKALSDVLKALGLDRERKTTKRLHEYVLESKNGKSKQ